MVNDESTLMQVVSLVYVPVHVHLYVFVCKRGGKGMGFNVCDVCERDRASSCVCVILYCC